jgi:tetratricopeptide (TPR) repeat protein
MDRALADETVAERLNLANEYARIGRVEAAEAILADIVARDPACIGARVSLAHLKRHGGDRTASLAILEAAAAIVPQHVGVRLEITDDLRELERFDEAQAILEQMVGQYPENIPVRIGISRLKRRQGNRADALAALETAATIDPSHVGVQLDRAADLRELGRADEAEAVLERLKDHEPRNTRVLVDLSRLKRNKGDRPGSLALAQAAVAIDPLLIGVQLEIADDLRELGRFDQAEAVLQRLNGTGLRNIGLCVQLAHLRRRRGDRIGSLAILDEAAAIDPQHTGVQLERADDLRELGRFSDAETVLHRVIAVDPQNIEGFISTSRLRRRQGDRAASLSALEAAAAIDPQHRRVQVERADDLRELGRLDEAEAVLRSLLDRDPQDAALLVSWSRLKQNQDDRSASLTALESAAAIAPQDVGIQLELIRELEHDGRFDEVESRLRRLLADSGSPAARSALASRLIASDRLEEAYQLCRNAIEADPTDTHILVRLGILARRRGDRWQALARLEAAYRYNPSSHEALQELATEHRELGHLAECRELLERALRENPDLLTGLLQKGLLYRKQGLHQDALQVFQGAVELHPQSNAAKIELARELRLLGRPAASLQILLDVIHSEPGDFTAFEQINEYFCSAENFAASLAVCEQWMRTFPHHGVPIARAGRALLELGEDERAFALLDADTQATHRGEIEAVKVDGHRRRQDFDAAEASLADWEASAGQMTAVWTRRIELAMDRGDHASAEQHLAGLAPVTATDRSRISITKGQIAEARWQTEAAADHFRQALQVNPDDAGLHFALSRVSLKLLDLDTARHHLNRYVTRCAGDSIARGQVSRSSQTHIGQLLDEFALDQNLLQQLKVALMMSSDRIDKLKQLVRAYPDHTPSAIALLIALRQDGLFAPAAAPSDELAIPRRIAQFFDSDDTPREIAALMDTWRENHPGFDYRQFNDATATDFLKKHHADAVYTAFARCREAVQRSDLFRLAYLASHGGIYADADTRCFRPLGRFLPTGTAFAAHQEESGAIGNGVLVATPQHPVIVAALELAAAAVNRGDADFSWLSTGPGLLARVFASFVAHAPDTSWRRTVTIFGLGEMKREVGLHGLQRYKKASKHWSWHLRQRQHRKLPLADIETEIMMAIRPTPVADPIAVAGAHASRG